MTRQVLITHPAGSWPGLAARFQGTPVALRLAETAIQVDPLDPDAADRALGHLDRYAWLVATSPRGVSALGRRLARNGSTLPDGLRVAAVGRATASALHAIGVTADVVAEESSSEGLAASLRPLLAGGARVLVVRPEGPVGPLAEALAASGASVDVAPLYRTIASEHAAGLAEAAIAGEFAAVVFTAPSSLDRWLEAAGSRRPALIAALAKVARVAIGPTTAAHLDSAGLPAAATAKAPVEGAIGDAIASALGL